MHWLCYRTQPEYQATGSCKRMQWIWILLNTAGCLIWTVMWAQSFNFRPCALQADNTYGDRNTKTPTSHSVPVFPLFTGLRIPKQHRSSSKPNLKKQLQKTWTRPKKISAFLSPLPIYKFFLMKNCKVTHNQVELSWEQLELKEAYFKMGKHLKPKSMKPAHASHKTKCQQYRLTITIS